jgi:copper transport protein
VRRLVVSLLLACVGVLAAAAPAGAHAELDRSDPAADAALDEGPDEVVLRFTEGVRASPGAIRVFDRRGERVDEGDLSRPEGDRTAAVTLPELGEGGYVVTWRVVSADSHPVSGGFTFRVGSSTEAVDADLVGELLAAEGGSSTVGGAYAAVRFLAFAGLIVLVGGVTFLVVVWPEGARLTGPGRAVWAAWGVAAGATVVGIGLQGAYEAGLELSAAARPSVIGDVLGTRFGTAWLLRLGLLAAALPLVVGLRRGAAARPVWRMVAVAVGVALLATPGIAGHASSGRLVPLALVVDVLHLAAVAVWIGGLVLLIGSVLRRRRADELRAVVPRFSSMAQVAVAGVVATGAVQGWRQVGSLDSLTSTTYGRLLLTKTLAFAGLVALGALSRAVVRRRLWEPSPVAGLPAGPGATLVDPDADTVQRLRASVGVELAVAVVILAVTALLVNTEPARSAEAQPFAATLAAEDVTVDAVVEPGAVGRNDIHLYASTPTGSPPLEATAEVSLPARDIAPIELRLEPTGPGHWSAFAVDLPIAGDWRLVVTLLLSDVDQARTETSFPIR